MSTRLRKRGQKKKGRESKRNLLQKTENKRKEKKEVRQVEHQVREQ